MLSASSPKAVHVYQSRDSVPISSVSKPNQTAKNNTNNHPVTGPEPYTEDTWKRVKIGYYEYAVSCRTTRCKLPNVDQDTGERHPSEPDKTLRTFRAVDPGAGPNSGCLGMQLVPIIDGRENQMKVGEEVIALEHGEHYYIKQ
jgi:uncharacterized protein YcbX